jgi:hypothetical protein
MYTTVSIKEQWRSVFCCGNTDNPEDVILIMGSCRVVPYLNYVDAANAVCGNRFKIYAIDPINYQIDSAGNMLDTRGLLKALETDDAFLAILKSVTIFIHEGLSSFGILNTVTPEKGDTWEKPVTIYDFGMKPRIDINIPNFHDVFILFNDFIAICPQWQKNLTEKDEEAIYDQGTGHIARFMVICDKSSFPEFGQWFRENYLARRLFHSFNHVSSAFTLEMFRLMNEKFLKLPLDDTYWQAIGAHDLYGNVSTSVTDLDRKWRDFRWG